MKKFNKDNKKKKVIISILAITLVGLVLIESSYAFFQRENEVTFINAKVGDFRVSLSNITATSTNNSINLSYTAGGYNASTTCAFGTTKGTYNLSSTTVNNNNCTKTGLSQNTTYYYKVCTKNKLNQESCKEGSINTKYNAPTLSNITATSTTTSIDLSYTESGTVSTRTCKYSTTNGSYTTNANSQTSTKCSITGLTAGTTYYYQVCVSNNGGENCKTGSIATQRQLLKDVVKVGDYVKMTPTSTSYTISKELTGWTEDQIINPSELNMWRVLNVKSTGQIEMISNEVSSTKVYFRGTVGYSFFSAVLFGINQQYGVPGLVEKSYPIGFKEGYTLVIEDKTKISALKAPWGKSTSQLNQLSECDPQVYLCGVDEEMGAGDTGHPKSYQQIIDVLGSLAANQVGTGTRSSYWVGSRLYAVTGSSGWFF